MAFGSLFSALWRSNSAQNAQSSNQQSSSNGRKIQHTQSTSFARLNAVTSIQHKSTIAQPQSSGVATQPHSISIPPRPSFSTPHEIQHANRTSHPHYSTPVNARPSFGNTTRSSQPKPTTPLQLLNNTDPTSKTGNDGTLQTHPLNNVSNSHHMKTGNLIQPPKASAAEQKPASKALPRVLSRQTTAETHKNAQLLEQIENALRPYVTSGKKPPLSLEQLFIISLLFNPGADVDEALRWVIANVPYYREQALDHFVNGSDRPSMVADFQGLTRQFELPIVPFKQSNNGSTPKNTFTTTSGEARTLLGKFLPPSSKTHGSQEPFRLMDLPAELRVMIYELALGFPKSGLMVNRASHGKASVQVATRDFSIDRSPWLWQSQNNSHVDPPLPVCRPLKHYLALLQTSKQIYFEAMPIFYSKNTFVCVDQGNLFQFLNAMRGARKRHIRHMTIALHIPVPRDFKLIKDLPNLRTLDIIMFESEWRAARSKNGDPRFPDLLEAEPIKVLRSMRGLKKVEFHGECDSISSILVPEMTQPMPERNEQEEEAQKKKGGRKRKADDGQDGGGSGKAKKSRKSKKS